MEGMSKTLIRFWHHVVNFQQM
jgi:hypothetical protein